MEYIGKFCFGSGEEVEKEELKKEKGRFIRKNEKVLVEIWCVSF